MLLKRYFLAFEDLDRVRKRERKSQLQIRNAKVDRSSLPQRVLHDTSLSIQLSGLFTTDLRKVQKFSELSMVLERLKRVP